MEKHQFDNPISFQFHQPRGYSGQNMILMPHDWLIGKWHKLVGVQVRLRQCSVYLSYYNRTCALLGLKVKVCMFICMNSWSSISSMRFYSSACTYCICPLIILKSNTVKWSFSSCADGNTNTLQELCSYFKWPWEINPLYWSVYIKCIQYNLR